MEGDLFGYFIGYLLLGSAAGVLSGLFGIGGGLILVPFLAWLYTLQGIGVEYVMRMAVATSLATIIITSLSSVYAHHSRHQAVLWSVVSKMAPGLLVGAILGSVIADNLPNRTLRVVFALYLIFVAVQMWIQQVERSETEIRPKYPFLLTGGVIGMISAILGIGGGTLTVPYLIKSHVPIGNAVAVSSACGLPIATFGALSYTILGWNTAGLPEMSFGYIYLPGFIGVISASFFFAPIGASLAHKVPTDRLKRMFVVLVCIVGIKLIWQ